MTIKEITECTYLQPAWLDKRLFIFPVMFHVFWRYAYPYCKKKKKNGEQKRWGAYKLLFCLWIYRWANSLSLNSHYYVDEYWQSLEPAHVLAYGYGFKTWEWDLGIRSYLHPLPFAIVYKLLAIFNVDKTALFIYAPKALQSFYSALIDFYTFQLADRFFGNDVAEWVLFLATSFWFYWYTLTRFLVNTFECLLNIIAFYYWPWSCISSKEKNAKTISHYPNLFISLFLGFIVCMIRPMSASLWLCAGFIELAVNHERRKLLFHYVIPIG